MQKIIKGSLYKSLLIFSLICSVACSAPDKPKSGVDNGQIRDKHGQTSVVAHTFVWDLSSYPTQSWKMPQYDQQEGRTGWTKDSFSTPAGIKANVNFWKNIYQKYTSNEGVLHDSFHIDLVYEEVDFRPIMANQNIDNREKLRQRRKMVESLKRKVEVAIKTIRKGEKLNSYAKDLKEKISKYEEKGILKELPKDGRLRFQLGQKDYIKKGKFQSGAYMDEIEEIFASYNLPKELTRLPYVESSFNLSARSKVGASGIWQIMPGTAKGKLARSYYYDYRNHPIEAAHVAAKLLRYNYKVLGDWPRALTAYNFGAAGMRRLSAKLKTKDISEMARMRSGRWGFAASNFYASFLALLDTERKAPELYGRGFKIRQSLGFQKIKIIKSLSWGWVKEQFPADQKLLRQLNPHFLFSRMEDTTYLKRNLPIYVNDKLKIQVTKAIAATGPYRPKYSYKFHQVRRGENLSVIAKRYNIKVSDILRINQISKASFIRAGQKIRVPAPK